MSTSIDVTVRLKGSAAVVEYEGEFGERKTARLQGPMTAGELRAAILALVPEGTEVRLRIVRPKDH